MDSDGNHTTDPQAALDGVMLPFGGMKGSAVTILLDILAGVLSGAEFGLAQEIFLKERPRIRRFDIAKGLFQTCRPTTLNKNRKLGGRFMS